MQTAEAAMIVLKIAQTELGLAIVLSPEVQELLAVARNEVGIEQLAAWPRDRTVVLFRRP